MDTVLLTPGPVTVSRRVREAMLRDYGTWDAEYLDLTERVRRMLLDIGGGGGEYAVVPLAGSGTTAVEAAIGSVLPAEAELAVLVNGAYGRRMLEIARRAGLATRELVLSETEPIRADHVLEVLAAHPEVGAVGVVHCETTTGLLNPLAEVVSAIRSAGKLLVVDAVSSFGGVPIDLARLGIDILASTANKCLQGVPGVSFVMARQRLLRGGPYGSTPLTLDIPDQWREMERSPGKWRFTSPTHAVAALHEALCELAEEGGVAARADRYRKNCELLVEGMAAMGFHPLIAEEWRSHVVTTFLHPTPSFDFEAFYRGLKQAGYLIYPGKTTVVDTFRIGSIGAIDPEVVGGFLDAVSSLER